MTFFLYKKTEYHKSLPIYVDHTPRGCPTVPTEQHFADQTSAYTEVNPWP